MNHKIDKNYLGETLSQLDVNGDKIVEPQEWINFFNKYPDNIWTVAKTLVTYILKDVCPDETLERLPMIADEILVNHSDNTDTEEKQVNLLALYDYITRLIAPKKYREFQKTLQNPERFFLHDGIIEKDDFDMFKTSRSNKILIADMYYLLISYNISPDTTFEVINYLIQESTVAYNDDDFTLDGDAVFELLSIEKYDKFIIDIDALLHYADICDIEKNDEDTLKLFDIHNHMIQKIYEKGRVDYDVAYNFLNFYHKDCLKVSISALFEALSVDLKNTDEFLNLIYFLGYVGKPHKIFREIAGSNKQFGLGEVKDFLNDNNIKFSLR